MKIIKRNGAEENFDISKIIMAVTKANAAVEECDRMTPRQIQRIAESVEIACQSLGRAPRPTLLTATPAAWCAAPTRPTTAS